MLERLPIELLEAVALFLTWDDYAALRRVCRALRLPWRTALAARQTRRVAAAHCAAIERVARPLGAAWAEGPWVLGGFHGVVRCLDARGDVVALAECERGALHGTLVIHYVGRGGTRAVRRYVRGAQTAAWEATEAGHEWG
jgi:hypothetical protein